tara:strand:- start:5650 stop:7107 length:1458 start_codon:yes stop_codon:yes gene_type:complete
MRAPPNYGHDLIIEFFDAGKSVLENARMLHDMDNKKSVKGWEMSIVRMKNTCLQDNCSCGVSVEPTLSKEEQVFAEKVPESYFYDQVNDEYFTFLSTANTMIKVSGDKHRAMKTAYSSMVGKPASINEVCREFGIPRAWFDEYRRRHGWTHDMDIYTDEQVAEGSVEQLVEDLVLKRRHEIHKKFESRKWKEIEGDADKYRMFDTNVLADFRNLIQEKASSVSQLALPVSTDPFSLVISPTDFHWGKYGWVDEVGETYNFEEAKSRLMGKTQELISRLYSKPEQIIISTGSDWFHVDNDAGTTTRGTPQDMYGSPAEILMTGCKLAREHIDLLRQVAPVKVVFMPGNHDRMSAISLMMYLSAVYEDCDDCEVIVSPASRQYVEYGNNLLGFIHGDGAKNLEELMSCEQRELWGKCEHHTWFHGHLHHRKVLESKGCVIIQLPSLAGHDRYHARQGYTTSKAGLAAHIIDKEKGIIGSMFAPVGEH